MPLENVTRNFSNRLKKVQNIPFIMGSGTVMVGKTNAKLIIVNKFNHWKLGIRRFCNNRFYSMD